MGKLFLTINIFCIFDEASIFKVLEHVYIFEESAMAAILFCQNEAKFLQTFFLAFFLAIQIFCKFGENILTDKRYKCLYENVTTEHTYTHMQGWYFIIS